MLSKKDYKIIKILKENCRLSARKISEKTGIPVTTIHNRIKRLEQVGVIKGYHAEIDNKKIGKEIEAFLNLQIDYRYQDSAAEEIRKMKGVEECYLLAGTTDVLAKIVISNIDELNNFIVNNLKNIKGVQKTTTTIVLKGF